MARTQKNDGIEKFAGQKKYRLKKKEAVVGISILDYSFAKFKTLMIISFIKQNGNTCKIFCKDWIIVLSQKLT